MASAGGEKYDRVYERFVVIHSVQHEIVGLRAKAVHCQDRTTSVPIAECLGISSRSRCVPIHNAARDAGNQRGQLGEIAPVERKFRDLASDYNVAET
jgi:hypothetical protein